MSIKKKWANMGTFNTECKERKVHLFHKYPLRFFCYNTTPLFGHFCVELDQNIHLLKKSLLQWIIGQSLLSIYNVHCLAKTWIYLTFCEAVYFKNNKLDYEARKYYRSKESTELKWIFIIDSSGLYLHPSWFRIDFKIIFKSLRSQI